MTPEKTPPVSEGWPTEAMIDEMRELFPDESAVWDCAILTKEPQ